MKVVLAIRSLDIGGAERQFVELVKGIDKGRFDVTVCTMYGGVWEERVAAVPGVRYVNLRKTGRYDLWSFGRRYRALLRKIRPDLLYAFLGEMNLFSLWLAPRETRVIWGLRASDMDLSRYDRMSRLLFSLQRRFSKRVDRIIANSHAAVAYHEKAGFDMRRATVIPNGIDIERFRPDAGLREAFRREWGVSDEEVAVGIVARIDPMKGYPVLAEAAKRVLRRYPQVRFFAAGAGDETIRQTCDSVLGKEVGERFHWLGSLNVTERLYNGLDLYVSSSLYGEGFSNSVAEAMACGTPCVVTDVGDSARIVGETGRVVPPGDPEALAEGIESMLNIDFKNSMLSEIRKRIVQKYSVEEMVKKTERVLDEMGR
jgi:glycosyltransferase involved in cell wall biosynthesis